MMQGPARAKKMPLLLLSIATLLFSSISMSAALSASPDSFGHFSNATYFDRGYSIYAVASELSENQYLVTVSLQFTPFFTTNDDIVRYQLIVNDKDIYDLSATMRIEAAPTEFGATISVTGHVDSMRVVPVFERGGESLEESLVMPSGNDGWNLPIGKVAAVKNPKPNERLNLRNAPELASEVWMQYYNGTPVAITNVLSDDWVAVLIGDPQGGARGYMKITYLVFDEAAKAVAPNTPIKWVDIPFTLYSQPESTASIIATFPVGTEVTVMGLSKTWWHVKIGDQTGYVRIADLEEDITPKDETVFDAFRYDGIPTYYLERNLQYYAKGGTTPSGYQFNASISESGDRHFDVNIADFLPDENPKDVTVGYNLYVNGVFKAKIPPQDEQSQLPVMLFYANIGIPETILSMYLAPILDRGGEHPNMGERIVFDIK